MEVIVEEVLPHVGPADRKLARKLRTFVEGAGARPDWREVALEICEGPQSLNGYAGFVQYMLDVLNDECSHGIFYYHDHDAGILRDVDESMFPLNSPLG